ncbi:hypothetical protein [Ancylomarina sp.]|uniref:hypothetical protein n=1 Tax=Ancylomarina sp. TaxID=1970196 RepID=UPI0035692268
MSKKKNKKKKLPQQKALKDHNCYKLVLSQFKETLYRAMEQVGYEAYFPLLKDSELELMRCSVLKPVRPICFPGHQIPSKKLQLINNEIQTSSRQRIFQVNDIYLSTQECSSLFALASFLENKADGVEILAEFRTKFLKRFETEKLYKLVYHWYGRLMLQFIISSSNPRTKYYAYTSSIETVKVRPFYMAYSSSIMVHNAQSTMLKIHGTYRPVFRLGKTDFKVHFKWISIPSSLVGNYYNGKEKELGVYIQSHALNRLAERLDILDESSLNFYLNIRMEEIHAFEFYRGYLLFPFIIVNNVKVGYFVANVVGDKLVFRTFLFVTHNCTPEGDRLKEISGLQKNDIKYWQFDRLSTFASANVDDNPALHNLLKEVGIDDLIKLKPFMTDSENLQDSLAGELMTYIEKGKRETEDVSFSENELCMG